MSTLTTTLALTAMLISTAASASRSTPSHDAAEPAYFPGSQYTASLDQTHNRWRLQPVTGQDLVIDTGTCATGAMVPPGVWLLVHDAQGRPELLAPSVTALPPGAPDRVALRSCERAIGRDLAVPQALLDLLDERTGAIYVYE
jgi:hypothetical protein